jgi:DNA-binding NarL/FixJ family response regulator
MHDKTVRILIADDHEAIREGVQKIVELQPGWTVCGMAVTGRQAVEQSRNLNPDIVVIDVSMPALNGLEATRQIKRVRPTTEVLVYTGFDGEELIPRAFEAGAKGFIFKSEPTSQLLAAIRSLSQHKPFFSDLASARVFPENVAASRRNPRLTRGRNELTARERETVQLLAEGKSNKEVAAALGVSVRTAETHRARLLRKLGLDSVAGLVRYAIRNCIIQP